MLLKVLPYTFSVCKVDDCKSIYLSTDFCFISKTDEECSLVCPTEIVPNNATKRDEGWKAFRIEGELDFSLIGVLARISEILAKEKIGIIAISTYNTDYIFTREIDFQRAIEILRKENYEFVKE
ncbi:MAG: ACT domain-containing protein [Bacteroidales bacterium]|nr:ACT domain-containing protein [Bacteroidales bacterium]